MLLTSDGVTGNREEKNGEEGKERKCERIVGRFEEMEGEGRGKRGVEFFSLSARSFLQPV